MADNGAAWVCEDPEIVEDVSVPQGESKPREDRNATAWDESDDVPRRRWKPLFGCCSKTSNNDGSIPPTGPPPLYHDGVGFCEIQSSRSFSQEMRLFLNSPVYYIFVIVVTFLTTIVLLVEVCIETGLFQAGAGTASGLHGSESENSIGNVSTALHWFSFALLAVFFVEIILRAAVFRLDLVKHYISVTDVVVVLIAFISDLCVTLVAGPGNPIDGISLIIVLRLVRIHSLILAKVEVVKKRRDIQIKEFENELHVANCKITGLQRQLREKDFEIKQLQEYLGGNLSTSDPQLLEAMKTSLLDQNPNGAAADSDLQMALALSKQSFKEKNGGVVNKAFAHGTEFEDLPVLIHERPNRLSSQESDIEPVPKVASYMEEYFSKRMHEDEPTDKLSSDPSKGAIPKKRSTNSSLRANSNDNNSSKDSYDFESALKVLQADEPLKQPITVSIDPAILKCDEPAATELESTKWTNLRAQESSEEPRSTFSSPASDVGSCDEGVLDSVSPRCQQPAKSQTDVLKTWAGKSGSSISSESGYLSEDGSGKKRFAISATNAKPGVLNVERETSAL